MLDARAAGIDDFSHMPTGINRNCNMVGSEVWTLESTMAKRDSECLNTMLLDTSRYHDIPNGWWRLRLQRASGIPPKSQMPVGLSDWGSFLLGSSAPVLHHGRLLPKCDSMVVEQRRAGRTACRSFSGHPLLPLYTNPFLSERYLPGLTTVVDTGPKNDGSPFHAFF